MTKSIHDKNTISATPLMLSLLDVKVKCRGTGLFFFQTFPQIGNIHDFIVVFGLHTNAFK